MKPAVYLYGVPGQYENYLAALESAGTCTAVWTAGDCCCPAAGTSGAPFRERSPF